jgi:hypothetical protein
MHYSEQIEQEINLQTILFFVPKKSQGSGRAVISPQRIIYLGSFKKDTKNSSATIKYLHHAAPFTPHHSHRTNHAKNKFFCRFRKDHPTRKTR